MNCKMIVVALVAAALLNAANDPAAETYRAWQAEHRRADPASRDQGLFQASGSWVKQWPDSPVAWRARRDAMVGLKNRSAELWKEVGENLIRVSPPHTFSTIIASDWVAADVNLESAEELLTAELEWIASQRASHAAATGSIADLLTAADAASALFGPLRTLATAQIKLKHRDNARATLSRLRTWLDEDFRRQYDQDPLMIWPDHEAGYFSLAARLARSEGRATDALAYYGHVITNPYFRRAYNGYVAEAAELWKEAGGSDDTWKLFSSVPKLPAAVPSGHFGVTFQPWIAANVPLPDTELAGLHGQIWTNKAFAGKATLMYLWATHCAPCWMHLGFIQKLHDALNGRSDIQVITLSADEDPAKVATFMKERGFTFPVAIGKEYSERLLEGLPYGLQWIVDPTGTIKLARKDSLSNYIEAAFLDESIYKLTRLSPRHGCE